jgi:uncharacterized membrane protein
MEEYRFLTCPRIPRLRFAGVEREFTGCPGRQRGYKSLRTHGIRMKRILKRADEFVRRSVYANGDLMEFLFLFLLVYVALDAIILLWFFSAPLAVQSGNRLLFGWGMLAYNVGYLTSNCHQMPERSIIIGNVEMPFCARDTAIYIGCIVGALAPFAVKPPRFAKSLIFAGLLMTPMAVDGVSQTIFSMRESSNALRIITGFLFGVGMVYFFAVRIVENAKTVDFRKETKKVLNIGLFTLVILLALSWIYADGYVTKEEAIRESGINPTFVTYVTKRALNTIHADPYFKSYNDEVLTALYGYGARGHGLWVIYEGPLNHEGKNVFFSPANGRLKLIPDVNST